MTETPAEREEIVRTLERIEALFDELANVVETLFRVVTLLTQRIDQADNEKSTGACHEE